MGIREAFIDPGDEFLKRLQTPESDKNPGEFKVDQYLGDFKSNSKSVRIVFRDHQQPDGDRVQIRYNDEVFYPNVLLVEAYKNLDVELKDGFNKFDCGPKPRNNWAQYCRSSCVWWSRKINDGQFMEPVNRH